MLQTLHDSCSKIYVIIGKNLLFNQLEGVLIMKCDNCKVTVKNEDEIMRHRGKNLCEDCYMEVVSIPKTCDPMAVRSAKLTRESQGQDGVDGLLPIQKEIYEFIEEKEKVSVEELIEKFNLNQQELQKQFAVLRHCELCRMTKEEDGRIFATTF